MLRLFEEAEQELARTAHYPKDDAAPEVPAGEPRGGGLVTSLAGRLDTMVRRYRSEEGIDFALASLAEVLVWCGATPGPPTLPSPESGGGLGSGQTPAPNAVVDGTKRASEPRAHFLLLIYCRKQQQRVGSDDPGIGDWCGNALSAVPAESRNPQAIRRQVDPGVRRGSEQDGSPR